VSERVRAELLGSVLRLTLNRPEKRNAMDREMIDGLHVELQRADLDADVGVVVIQGAGSDFCAGADLAELLASAEKSPDENVSDAAHLGKVFEMLRALPKVTIAVVRGRALAGGCGLATACDLVLAHEDATFGYPEIRRGFVPAMVMAMLRRSVGEKVAFDLVATGRSVSSVEGVSLGLISRVIAGDRFDVDIEEIISGVAGHSLSALSLTKRQLYALDGLSFAEGIALGAKTNAAARSTPDFTRAVSAFLNKK